MANNMRDADIYQKIESILENKRNESAVALDNRIQQLSSVCPEISTINLEMQKLGLKYNKMMLLGEKNTAEACVQIDTESATLRRKKSDLLASLGYPSDYLELKHSCSYCKDTGFLFDESGPAVRCSCYRQMLLDNLYSQSNILSAGNAGFHHFNEQLFSDITDEKKYAQKISPRNNMVKIKSFAMNFVSTFSSQAHGENLYFFGHAGTGKTFMAASIAQELMSQGFTVLYQSAPALFNIITEYRMRAFRDDNYHDAVYRNILESDLLIIDDLGTESMTNARYSEFITLLNERLADVQKRTIISTNMDLLALKNLYDERITSRIIGAFNIMHFFGDDIRIIQKMRG